jgi:hypothetical protein
MHACQRPVLDGKHVTISGTSVISDMQAIATATIGQADR